MARVLASPQKYIQGPGEISRIHDHLSSLGGPVLFVMGKSAYRDLKGKIEKSYSNSTTPVFFERFGGECTRREIDRLRAVFREHGCRVVAGVGGGKALDTAKGVACFEDAPVVSIPTIASTDAPTSAIAVTYTEDHVFDGNIILSKNPEIVLADIDVIMRAPVRFLVAGMGDALSTYFEARANAASGHDNFVGGKPTNTSVALATLCYEILLRDGVAAKKAAEAQTPTPELENVIEANIYLSGIGFESNGIACAHSVYNAFTTIPSCHQRYHGELVAFGTLVQMILEGCPEQEIARVLRFCTDVGLPVTFDGISDVPITSNDLKNVAIAACGPQNFMDSMPFAVTPEMVVDALKKADVAGRRHLVEL